MIIISEENPKFLEGQKVYFHYDEDDYVGVVIGFEVIHSAIKRYIVNNGRTNYWFYGDQLYNTIEELEEKYYHNQHKAHIINS